MSEKKERNFIEAIMEGAEATWDLFIENEAVQAVPVVGSAFKILKGVDDLQSRALQRKLHKFLSEPALRHAVEARKLRDEILENDGRDEEIGEMLFLVLGNVTDLTKPVLLAKAYAAYLDGEINAFGVEQIAHVINVTFLRDLLDFLNPAVLSTHNHWKDRLVSAGLMSVVDKSWSGDVTNYRETPLGNSFRHAITRPWDPLI